VDALNWQSYLKGKNMKKSFIQRKIETSERKIEILKDRLKAEKKRLKKLIKEKEYEAH